MRSGEEKGQRAWTTEDMLVGTAHVKNVGHKLAQQQERAALRSKDEDMEGGALPVTECQGELRFSLTYVRSHKNVYK